MAGFQERVNKKVTESVGCAVLGKPCDLSSPHPASGADLEPGGAGKDLRLYHTYLSRSRVGQKWRPAKQTHS